VADRHGHGVHHGGGDRDPDEHRHRPVARGERERHELGLVAQLGDEHHAEADRERDQEAVHGAELLESWPDRGTAAPIRHTRVTGSKVSLARR
jgi:hypothetical protein